MTELPSGPVIFLFTDIQGSTPLWERDPEAMRAALARHNAILQAAIAEGGGQVFKTIGDAFQAAFAVPAQAVTAALAAQRGLASEPWGVTGPLRVRMGLHLGSAQEQAGDYAAAHTLNRVARIMSAGHGGQILISMEVADRVRGQLLDNVTLRDMGEHRMKGLTRLEHLFQVVALDLPADFPPLNTLDLSPNNLPLQSTSFIGRKKEVAEVKRLLSEARLVTLTGSGGCGKTRLALQAAAELQADYPHGVWLAELAPLADPALLPQTIAILLGLREEGGRPWLPVVAEFLRVKALLLVLDNCEHLIDACAQLAETLLRACPKVRILASSREALGIGGETTLRIPSLSAPDSGRRLPVADLLRIEAVELFVDRATLAEPAFTLTVQNAPAVAQICRRLDGIPLALELAAARVKVLSVEQVAARLDDRFRLLTGGSRTALPRQQTLRALIDWSYNLLSEPERVLFRRLSAFAGGWTLEASEAVCADDEGPTTQGDRLQSSSTVLQRADVLDLLTRLVDKSLVMKDEQAGEARYHRLETIRQYAREKFLESGEVEDVRRRHCHWFLRLAEAAEPKFGAAVARETLDLLEAEHDNLRAALAWSLETEPASGLRLAGALGHFWQTRGYHVEGREILERALEAGREAPPGWRAMGLMWAGLLASHQGDFERSREQLTASLNLYRELRDQSGIAAALNCLGNVAWSQGDHRAAGEFFDECLTIRRELDDRSGVAGVLSNQGNVAWFLGDYAAARRLNEESLALFRELGQKRGIATALNNLGIVAEAQGELPAAQRFYEESLACSRESSEKTMMAYALNSLGHVRHLLGERAAARGLYTESLAVFQDLGDRRGLCYCLEGFALVAAEPGSAKRKARLFAAAAALREQIGAPLAGVERAEYDRHVAALRAELDAAEFTAASAEGRSLTLEQAIMDALEDDEDA